ncbi:FAD-dependent oxidoreductase [Bradyrhizobium valentinum]|uniref:FAD-dependent oxidoreductase n=1 Tax=Bradyrhizobium valentinum TaxID=1518501 RepID=A0A0R3K947_9BRAD|nr:FAD-dependent oxidoreductase [Bradyrhizobium valentinum]KRQ89829.1 FAD-dependent oxidoreductase [Bradyrhizobium valentinum]
MDARSSIRLDSDVVVVGGGAAGVAAAVASARKGLNVTLIERYGFCGGGAVAGLSGTVCGLYEATNNVTAGPKQIVFGFADEFCQRLEARGGLGDPLLYGKTWARVHDPIVWREVADALLREVGVRVIFHAHAQAVRLEGEKIEGIGVWTKQGPVDARAKIIIDASGDADIVAMAGLPNFVGDNGAVQNPTMIFRMMGVDVDRFVGEYGVDTIMPEKVSAMIRAKHNAGDYRLPRAKIWLFPTTRPGELLCNCTRVIGPDGRELNTLFYQDFTDAEIEGRLQAREYARFFRDNLVGCEGAFLNDTGVQVGVRQTRQVSGVKRLANSDVVRGTKVPDGIAVSPWPIELHRGDKPKVEWLLNDYYEVPYGCFVPERGEGLLVAGRCLSAEHEAVASARVTAQCFSYGHAIGLAAAVAVREKLAPRSIDGKDVRALLNADGARID